MISRCAIDSAALPVSKRSGVDGCTCRAGRRRQSSLPRIGIEHRPISSTLPGNVFIMAGMMFGSNPGLEGKRLAKGRRRREVGRVEDDRIARGQSCWIWLAIDAAHPRLLKTSRTGISPRPRWGRTGVTMSCEWLLFESEGPR